MGKLGMRTKANLILGVAGVGILATYPFSHTFGGGLLFAAFSAATIGGLADSFAVSALFGHPLRIPWPRWMGTRIIARQRERLIGELTDLVERELLTVEHVSRTLRDIPVADLLLGDLRQPQRAEELGTLAAGLAADLLQRVDAEELATGLQRYANRHADALQASDLLADLLEWSLRAGADDAIVRFATRHLAELAGSAPIRSIIREFAAAVVLGYEAGKPQRRFVDRLAGLDADTISAKVQDWLARFLREFGAPGHSGGARLKAQLGTLAVRLREDEALRAQVERYKVRLLAQASVKLSLPELLARKLAELRERLDGGADGSQAHRWLTGQIRRGIEWLAASETWRTRLDTELKRQLEGWVERNHAKIGALVQDKLGALSEQELIAFVKDKAHRDLQYIRLNGMIVGALVGIALDLSTAWLGEGRL
ncbi:DUF445 domain-containing protein [Paenibacillus sp. IB182496]|uniref:DUF445 domain-containing protein n=1 Tax=Paenibacillus sabuli TaxID=2772509 RepID=A0A927BW16_9BACL|nr:DUF445 domain-containing protein [Paenibacillus sabuli]MBD2846685.1 DUF445 domain-containing protein [Paenibacillus sabuli]